MYTITKKYSKSIYIIILVVLVALSIKPIREKYSLSGFEEALARSAKISEEHWSEKYSNVQIKDKYKIVFVTNAGGEYSYAEYFKYAAEKKGWEVKIYSENMIGYEEEIFSFDPDIILFTDYTDNHRRDAKITTHRSKKYLMHFVPASMSRAQGGIKKRGSPYEVADGFAELISYVHGVLTQTNELGYFSQVFARFSKPFYGTGILCSAPALENQPAEPTSLAWGGMGWDNFRASDRYKKMITLLSENIPMKIYGSYSKFSYLKPLVYGGYIPAGMQNIEAIRKNGIYLLTHSDLHIQAGSPSVRLFEAAAANVSIISDRHPFVEEHFGDSVLYFDQNAEAETMYAQIKAHVDWIKANPEEAKAMAARAHQIFLENFTLDKDLVKIVKMHEYVLLQEKAMKLDYNLAY